MRRLRGGLSKKKRNKSFVHDQSRFDVTNKREKSHKCCSGYELRNTGGMGAQRCCRSNSSHTAAEKLAEGRNKETPDPHRITS